MKESKVWFVLINSLKAIVWFVAFALVYLLFKKYIDIDFVKWLQPFFDNQLLIFLIFLTSELVVGLIPPELFIIWALRNDQIFEFVFLVTALSVISYLAGIVGYFIGRYLNTTVFYRLVKRRFLGKLDSRLQVFGIYLILIAALTPLPFSGVGMLIGSVRFPFRKFALFALSRFFRFLFYSLILWNINPNI